ncbi:MAG TPA: hypothetical protein DCL08_05095, partial [Anaerolineaceae bacterium]|nr:hypothetical protein [Anaerolineaceae bacterium]
MPIKVPETKKLDFFEEIHGQKIADPYRWMEDLESEEIRAWIDAENALTFDFLERFPLRKNIQER